MKSGQPGRIAGVNQLRNSDDMVLNEASISAVVPTVFRYPKRQLLLPAGISSDGEVLFEGGPGSPWQVDATRRDGGAEGILRKAPLLTTRSRNAPGFV